MVEPSGLTYIQAVFLGLVQGLTEFLPVSSSGHLVVFSTVLGVNADAGGNLVLEVLLHLGTLVAVFIAYRKDIYEMIVDFFSLFPELAGKRRKTGMTSGRKMILMIVISVIPLVFILPIKDTVEALHENTLVVGAALCVTAALLFLADKMRKGKKDISTASWLDAIIVGVFQAIAVTPGLSRSGLTITGGLVRGFDRRFAVRFAFLMSIPAMLGANLLVLKDALSEGLPTESIGPYAVGMAVAAVSGFFAIRLLKFVSEKGKFGWFAAYCAVAGAAVIVFSLV